MKSFRQGLLRVLPLGLSWTVLGCHAPDTKPPGFPQFSNRSPATAGSAKTPTVRRAVNADSVLSGLRPADSLAAGRPAKSQRRVSVARFVQDLEVPKRPAQERSQKTKDAQQNGESAFAIPTQIPGAEAPQFTIPERGPDETYETYRERLKTVYAELPELPPVPFSPGDAAKERISLAELQQIALANSPAIRAAAARVEQARGEALQAGLYPNPEAGYQSDTVNTGDTAGYHGVYASQTIVTADKLEIAQARACQDVAIAELELRRVQIDLTTAVRRHYFQALIAQERLNLARALVELFQRGYEAQIDLVAALESAAYEPLQFRVFALEARNAAIKAGNDYVASWRALQAVLNAPNLTPSELEGTPEMAVPRISYESALELLLSRHTDLAIAQTRIARSGWNLTLQEVTPIPNVDVEGVVQYDDTTPLNDVSYNLKVGVALPIFDKNQGNIYAAQSQILENHEKLQSAQNDLAARLAELYAQYETQRALAEAYRREILPDQVRTYHGVAQGFRAGAEGVDFAQVIVTQQQLGQVVGEYINVLEAQWRAVVDLAEVLQAEDLSLLDQGDTTPPSAPANPNSLLVPLPEPDRGDAKPK